MKTLLAFLFAATLGLAVVSCQQSALDPNTTTSAARSGAKGGDSTHVHGPHSLTPVSVSALPAAVTAYINANYAGATIKHAATNADGTLGVVIMVNQTPKVLLFNADGSFSKALDGKMRGDSAKGHEHGHMKGDSTRAHMPGDTTHHKPKQGDHKGGGPQSFTTVEASALPAGVTTYINTNYAGATIEKAAKDANGLYVVSLLTADKKRVGLLFNADGAFKSKLGR